MLLCLISWIIITNIGCTSKISSLSQNAGSNVVSAGEWKYLNDLMLTGRHRRESYISCSQSPIQNNMTLKGGIQAGYFRKLAEHVAMQLCVELCCEDKGCDVAFMTGKSCYGVQCFNEELCRAFPAKRQVNDPVLISHVTFKGEKVLPKDQVKGKLQCVSTRIKVGSTLRGGLKAGNFTDVGIVEDPKVCVNLCCVSETCNVAMMINERCFLVTCFSTRLCQMVRSLTPLYLSSLAYVQRKPLVGKKDKGNSSLTSDDSDSQLVCKNSKIFYNSTLKGGYHAGNYTNFGMVPNISACIRWCCGNRDCDAAFMLENNCFAVACKNPDDCLPVHAKSSSSSAALKPRISYITSRSEEVSVTEDVSAGGICHAGIVSYDVTLRGGSNAGKFTPHGVVNNMKTCIFKCCQSEGCNVAMMLKDSCFTVVCDSDEKCEKKQTPISSHFNPRIAYVFRNKVSKLKKKATKEKSEPPRHHETLKHKKKMLLIQQLHALTNPYDRTTSNPDEKQNQRPLGIPEESSLKTKWSPENTSPTSSANEINPKDVKPVQQKSFINNVHKNTSQVKFIPKSYITYNNTKSWSAQKIHTMNPPIYDFLRGNFAVTGNRLSLNARKMLGASARDKQLTDVYLEQGYRPYGRRLSLNATHLIHQPLKVLAPSGNPKYHRPLTGSSDRPLSSYPVTSPRNNIDAFLWNKKLVNHFESSSDARLLNPTSTGKPVNISVQSKRSNTTIDQSLLSDNIVNNTSSVRDDTSNMTNSLNNDDRRTFDTSNPSHVTMKQPISMFDPYEDETTTNIVNQTEKLDTGQIVNNVSPPQTTDSANSSIATDQSSSTDSRRNGIPSSGSFSNPDTVSGSSNITVASKNPPQSSLSSSLDSLSNNNSLPAGGNVTNVTPFHFDDVSKSADHVQDDATKTNIKIGNSDPTCFRSKIFYNVTLRGGYDSGKFRDRGKMKDVIECATLCCHLNKCDLVMMLLNRCFSVDCKNSNLCESVPAKSPIFTPTICYVSHI